LIQCEHTSQGIVFENIGTFNTLLPTTTGTRETVQTALD